LFWAKWTDENTAFTDPLKVNERREFSLIFAKRGFEFSGIGVIRVFMTKDQIRKRIHQRPFRPFKVRLAGGEVIDVPTADHVHLHPNGRTLFVHLNRGGTEIIDVQLVTSLQTTEVE
jgi:hypothetical protein